MNTPRHHYRTFEYGSRFVHFAGQEEFAAREQQVQKEAREAADKVKENLGTMTVEEAVKQANDKIDTLKKTNVDWYINHKELYSERGNQYQLKIYEICKTARQLIRNRMEDFNFTRGIVEKVTTKRTEIAGLQPEYNRLNPLLSKATVNVNINSSEDIEATYTSLDNLLDMKADTEALYRNLGKAHRELDFYQKYLPKGMQSSIKTELANVQKQLDSLQSGYTTLVNNYNKGLQTLTSSIQKKVEEEEVNVGKYRDESGALQEKAKGSNVKSSELQAAFQKYQTQKSYSRNLQAFQDVLGVYHEIPGSGGGEGEKEKEQGV